jgi:hypothetical protein
LTQETTALSCRARGMASVREGGKVDGSGTRRSWPFIQAQRSLAGPQGHGTPLWIVGRHEAAPCRSDVICITFRALHWYFSHTTTRKREYNGSTSFEAEPLVRHGLIGRRRRLFCTCRVSMAVSRCSLCDAGAVHTWRNPSLDKVEITRQSKVPALTREVSSTVARSCAVVQEPSAWAGTDMSYRDRPYTAPRPGFAQAARLETVGTSSLVMELRSQMAGNNWRSVFP